MSSLWVSHSSDSTGQMIALDKVIKIRTFKQNKDGRTLYRMVFETEVQSISQVSWDFVYKENALKIIERIVKLIDPSNDDPTGSQIFKDLAKGFE